MFLGRLDSDDVRLADEHPNASFAPSFSCLDSPAADVLKCAD